VVDGETLKYEATVPGCPDASGVLCTQGAAALVFAAARGATTLPAQQVAATSSTFGEATA